MRLETCLKLKTVLTLASGGYSVNGAKRWLREKGEGIGEGCYYKYSKVFVDLPLEELTSLYGERPIELIFWSKIELLRVRVARLNYFQVLNPVTARELEEECEAEAEELLKALKEGKRNVRYTEEA